MVDIVNLTWCGKQPKGIKLIEPSDDIADEYFETAKQTLDVIKAVPASSNVWLATTKYYLEYFTVYGLLMKLGIRSEIHDCTLAICSLLEKEGLLAKGTYDLLSDDKKLQTDNQYYLKDLPVTIDYEQLVNFYLTIKNTAEKLTLQQKTSIREKIEKLLLLGKKEADQ
ncbi:hypothetical protein HYU18_00625 [Candidatus Woesearchaeota archaeon]|nr:hypothetical protein [Candidatus Woesearchaeota archaeon]